MRFVNLLEEYIKSLFAPNNTKLIEISKQKKKYFAFVRSFARQIKLLNNNIILL